MTPTFSPFTDLLHQQLSQVLSQEKQAQLQDDEVERRIEALLAVGGKYDLGDADNIQEAICEAPQEFWSKVAMWRYHPGSVGNLCEIRVRDYFTKKAKDDIEEEIEAEAQRAQNPELVNRDA